MQDQSAKDKALQSMASMSSAQIVSASAIHNKIRKEIKLNHILKRYAPKQSWYKRKVTSFT
jgi:hypothetical protein